MPETRSFRVPFYNRGPGGELEEMGDDRREVSVQCAFCKRARLNLACAAFKGPIPEEILSGRHDHTKPFPGDRGLLFIRLEPGEMPDGGWADDPGDGD
jgi:hypothetical protein